MIDLGDKKLDALKELSNIGAGKASESLSEIIGEKVEVEFPKVEIEEADELTNFIGEDMGQATAIAVEMYTDLEGDKGEYLGRVILILEQDSAKALSDIMIGQEHEKGELTEMHKAALGEAGNILGGHCFTATSKILKFDIFESQPIIESGDISKIKEELVLDINNKEEGLAIFDTSFHSDKDISAYFLMLFNEKGCQKVLNEIND